LLNRFGKNEIQVMLGTQMIAKGLDYPNVTLVGVVSGDTALSLPDFRAAERTFQLITQVAGRAGRGDAPGRVILQTYQPDDPTIRAAIRQDYVGFAKSELALRKQVGYPPFARMVRIVLRDQEEPKLLKMSEELAAAIHEAANSERGPLVGATLVSPSSPAKTGDTSVAPTAQPAADVGIIIKGPMPCAINRIAGYHRSQIVMLSPDVVRLQRILAKVRESGALAKSDRIAVDVDPISLL
jgi:primosomal protein N' (replication factor Y)